MKITLLVLFVTCVCLVNISLAEKIRKYKKYRKHGNKLVPAAIAVEDSKEETLGEDEFKKIENNENSDEENNIPIIDACLKVHCGAGRVCEVDSDGEPQCVCVPECPIESESRRKVCSNHNETWSSDCAVYQQRCLCIKGDPKCKGEDYKHVHIEYYGECRETPECTKDEMADFPRRMRDWLFNIMRDLADRQELTPHYLRMEREAETNLTRRWTNAAVWKFCDLDGHPPDRSVSRHELFPIRAPLMALEHCIAPFLNDCDSDGDHRITLQEWTKCLELEEGDIEDRCEEIQDEL